MARKESDLSAFMLVQQLDESYWDWSDEDLQAITSRDTLAIAEVVGYKLLGAGMLIDEMHAIVHNKDTREVWDGVSSGYVIEQKPDHIHIVCRFGKDTDGKIKGGTLTKIASTLGVEPQYVEKPKKGKFAYDNMLAYLIHIKYADKAQYNPADVITCTATHKGQPCGNGKEFMEYYNERKKEWLEGKAKVKAEAAKVNIDNLEERILTGEICRNQILLTDELYDIYARNKRRCDDALDTYAQRKIAKTVQAMENGKFKLSVFFITGKSHSGKSMFTDALVKHVKKEAETELGEQWSVCSVAASNPFDEYMGEEILVMDDLRGMALTASDWLKLLDPDRSPRVSARYRNKQMACRAIIINSEKDILDFFYYMKGAGGGDRGEAMDQFYRRIMARVMVYRVPDTDIRRIEKGNMQEVDGYTAQVADKSLTLHHDFEKDVEDLSYDEAITKLSETIMTRNKLKQ